MPRRRRHEGETPAELPPSLLDRLNAERRAAAEAHLDERVAEVGGAGIAASASVEVGHPVTTIVQVADQGEFDYIVMGTEGRGLVGRLLAGSVAAGVVRAAPCAVMTVREARRTRRAVAA